MPADPQPAALEQLALTLELSERSLLAFALAPHEGRPSAATALTQRLGTGVALQEVRLTDEPFDPFGLLRFVETPAPGGRAAPDTATPRPQAAPRRILYTYGLDDLSPAHRADTLRAFNYHRDSLRDSQVAFVFWIAQSTLNDFALFAPDLWSVRGGVFDLSNVPRSAAAQLRADYLAHLRRTHRALDLKLPQLENFTRELMLEEIYVPLLARPELPTGETWERRVAGRKMEGKVLAERRAAELGAEETLALAGRIEAGPVRIEQALAGQTRLVVIGDPGSGKTTLLKHLALKMANEPNAPLPILVPLNALAEARRSQSTDHSLQSFFADYFASRAPGLNNLTELFNAALADGQAVVLLDGLDEVQADRQRLVEKVEAFAGEAAARGNSVVVTSRIVGYRDAPLDSTGWALYTLLDFDQEAIDDFTGKWCLAFEKSVLGDTPEARAAAGAERRSLLAALEANPGVERLASNPLLLTILALIKRQGVSLPNRRVELYEVYLKTLISAWGRSKSLDKTSVGVGPTIDYASTVQVLGPLALWLREENPNAGIVTEEQLLKQLTTHYLEDWGQPRGEARKSAREFLESVRRYSNLLLERGPGRYGFIHLTFEEALAARGLVQKSQLQLEDSLSVIRQHVADPQWRETILLAVGVWGLVREQPRVAGEAVRAMLKMGQEGVLLAGACLEDVGESGLTRAAAHDVRAALHAAHRERSWPPTAQRDAGFILGRTGWVPDDLDRFIAIPAGMFLYGDEKRKVEITQPFAIAKYPVTNLQYEKFVEDRGYERKEFWSAEGWSWRTGAYDTKATEDYEKRQLANRPPDKRHQPFFWEDRQWNNPLAPVVGVCWFEAEAYTNWLTKKEGQPFRLPTEEEWERAARHTDGREYPWGNKFDHKKLNSAHFWAGKDELDWQKWFDDKGYEQASTTIVGQFPEGESEAGLSDMSGNVWEWTNSWHDEKQIHRVVRGGSWDNGDGSARCACRDGGAPVYFYGSIGFRLLSPVSDISGF